MRTVRRVLIGGILAGAIGLTGAPTAAAQLPLDHFKCYTADGPSPARTVALVDQFERKRTLVLGLVELCTPVQKNAERLRDSRAHLACYAIRDAPRQGPFRREIVSVSNQFGTSVLVVERPRTLCVPSLKSSDARPIPIRPNPQELVDHFKCYDVTPRSAFAARDVTLTDQFGQSRARLLRPARVCNPVRKDSSGVRRPTAHLTCYELTETGFAARSVRVRNQFGIVSVRVLRPARLCVPSTKRRIPQQRFGARCSPKTVVIFHGGAGIFRILPNPGSAPILSTAPAGSQPTNTASYRITRNAAPPNSFTFRSKKVDPPPRVVTYIVRIRVRFGTPSNVIASIIVKCVVRVVHAERRSAARCRPASLDIPHGGAGIFRIVPVPGSAPIASTGLAGGQPGQTPAYVVSKLAGNGFRFRSTQVDGPRRVVVHTIRVRVRFGAPGAIVASIVVKCVARVAHEEVVITPQPPPPSPVPTQGTLTVTLTGSGDGFVQGNGINCSRAPTADCTETYPVGTQVTLVCQASPNNSCTFTSGCDSGNGTNQCALTMNANRTVNCNFSGPTIQSRLFDAAASVFAPAVPTEIVQLRATLMTRAEIPRPVGRVGRARGTFTATLDPDAETLQWRLTFSGLTGRALHAHIHTGGPRARTTANNIATGLCSPCRSPRAGTTEFLTRSSINALRSGRTYVNVHTNRNFLGEIRGQLRVVP